MARRAGWFSLSEKATHPRVTARQAHAIIKENASSHRRIP
jgi:hypothetical protein